MIKQKSELSRLRQKLEWLKPALKSFRELSREGEVVDRYLILRERQKYVPHALEISRRIRVLKAEIESFEKQSTLDAISKYEDYLRGKGINLNG